MNLIPRRRWGVVFTLRHPADNRIVEQFIEIPRFWTRGGAERWQQTLAVEYAAYPRLRDLVNFVAAPVGPFNTATWIHESENRAFAQRRAQQALAAAITRRRFRTLPTEEP